MVLFRGVSKLTSLEQRCTIVPFNGNLLCIGLIFTKQAGMPINVTYAVGKSEKMDHVWFLIKMNAMVGKV